MGGARVRWRVPIVVLLLAVVATLAPVAHPAALADSGMESQFVAAINRERTNQGLGALKVATDLTTVARRHSGVMADRSDLHHNPNLGSDVGGWRKVGENVGRGHSVDALHAAFMASASHKRNVLDPDWTQVGVGVVVVEGRIWVTVVFRVPAAAAPPPEPVPDPPAGAPPADPPTTSTKPQASAGSDSAPPPEPTPPPPPAPTPEPVEHELVEQPLPLDRMTVTLARLEAAERDRRLEDVLDG